MINNKNKNNNFPNIYIIFQNLIYLFIYPISQESVDCQRQEKKCKMSTYHG